MTFDLTSDENMVAHVPMHQATMGLVMRPDSMAADTRYSSVPPTWTQEQTTTTKFHLSDDKSNK